MAVLKTDYKDDILNVYQNNKRKYSMTENPDNTYSIEDETVYAQKGDSFGAADINATNTQVNTNTEVIGTLNDNLSHNPNLSMKLFFETFGGFGLMASDGFSFEITMAE